MKYTQKPYSLPSDTEHLTRSKVRLITDFWKIKLFLLLACIACLSISLNSYPETVDDYNSLVTRTVTVSGTVAIGQIAKPHYSTDEGILVPIAGTALAKGPATVYCVGTATTCYADRHDAESRLPLVTISGNGDAYVIFILLAIPFGFALVLTMFFEVRPEAEVVATEVAMA